MVKPELGTKRICVACGARFYDLQRTPAVCPKCSTEQPPEQPRVRRPAGNVVEDKRPKKPVPAAEDGDAEIEPAEDSDEDVLADTADIDEDEDDTMDEDLDVAEPNEEN